MLGTDGATGHIGAAGASCRTSLDSSDPLWDDNRYIVEDKKSRAFIGLARLVLGRINEIPQRLYGKATRDCLQRTLSMVDPQAAINGLQ